MTPNDDAKRSPVCEKCEREMMPVGKLPRIGTRKAVRVYRCLPCQSITSTPFHD
jgi:hypothetical protein